jgi:hypothetical protein
MKRRTRIEPRASGHARPGGRGASAGLPRTCKTARTPLLVLRSAARARVALARRKVRARELGKFQLAELGKFQLALTTGDDGTAALACSPNAHSGPGGRGVPARLPRTCKRRRSCSSPAPARTPRRLVVSAAPGSGGVARFRVGAQTRPSAKAPAALKQRIRIEPRAPRRLLLAWRRRRRADRGARATRRSRRARQAPVHVQEALLVPFAATRARGAFCLRPPPLASATVRRGRIEPQEPTPACRSERAAMTWAGGASANRADETSGGEQKYPRA